MEVLVGKQMTEEERSELDRMQTDDYSEITKKNCEAIELWSERTE